MNLRIFAGTFAFMPLFYLFYQLFIPPQIKNTGTSIPVFSRYSLWRSSL